MSVYTTTTLTIDLRKIKTEVVLSVPPTVVTNAETGVTMPGIAGMVVVVVAGT